MSRAEFVIYTAIILFVAFCMGWFAHWLMHRFSRVSKADVGELERMAQELHEAEETRAQHAFAVKDDHMGRQRADQCGWQAFDGIGA